MAQADLDGAVTYRCALRRWRVLRSRFHLMKAVANTGSAPVSARPSAESQDFRRFILIGVVF
jgi:hypothetical protein